MYTIPLYCTLKEGYIVNLHERNFTPVKGMSCLFNEFNLISLFGTSLKLTRKAKLLCGFFRQQSSF